MRRAGGESEIWADGYSYLELRHDVLGLVPYHHETRPAACTRQPLEPVLRKPLNLAKSTQADYPFMA